jgi:hypothetical protein
MLIHGVWLVCPDGAVRPVLRGEVEGGDGSWVKVPFLVDTAADRTVLSADVWAALQLPPVESEEQLSGLGGKTASVVVETLLRMTRDGDVKVTFRGQYAAVTEAEALDLSVLGRDVLNLFALIVDRPRDVVCLLGQRHEYTIVER